MITAILSFHENMTGSELPRLKRQKGEGKIVGTAAQAFNVAPDRNGIFPGWIAGNLNLPPKGIKDAEGVGLCCQVFFVVDCQPLSVEIAIDTPNVDSKFDPENAERFLLSKNDTFHVPAKNMYRIQNHSKVKNCLMFWTIIRPIKPKKQNK